MDPQTWRSLRTSLSLCTVFLLCLLYMAVPIVLRLTSGMPFYAVAIGLECIWRAMGLCILVFVFYLYQRVLYDLLRRKIRHLTTWVIVVLLPVVLLGAGSVYRSLPPVRAQRILGTGELAPLPESATQIAVYTWWMPTSGEEYLRFRASREDIASFVAKSPILRGAKYRAYSKATMGRLDQNQSAHTISHSTPDRQYVRRDSTAPPWYMEEIKCNARRYQIPRTAYKHRGEVIIDEDNDVVYVKLVFS